MSGTINKVKAPKCGYCEQYQALIVPLFYPGEGVFTFTCKNPDCEHKVTTHVEPKP